MAEPSASPPFRFDVYGGMTKQANCCGLIPGSVNKKRHSEASIGKEVLEVLRVLFATVQINLNGVVCSVVRNNLFQDFLRNV